MKKGYSIVCIVLAAGMLFTSLAGCNYKSPEPEPTSEPTPEPTPVPEVVPEQTAEPAE